MKNSIRTNTGKATRKTGNLKSKKPAEPQCEPPALSIVAGEVAHTITDVMLDDLDALEQLVAECNGAEQPTKVYLDALLTLSDQHRLRAIDLASQLENARFVVANKKYTSPLDAVLQLPVDADDIRPYTRGKLAMIEIAAICHPDGLEVCARKIRDRLRDAGATGLRVDDILTECRKALRALRALRAASNFDESAELAATHVREHYSDAPVPEDAVIPAGWRRTPDGIERLDKDSHVIAPVFIVERGMDAERKVEMMTIAWQRDGKWHTRTAERSQIADTRLIVGLSAYGTPITSNNARQYVQFFADYESANSMNLPVVHVTSRMGWQGEHGFDGFLWGRKLITGNDESDVRPVVRFCSVHPGIEQLADGLHSRGKLDTWLAAIDGLNEYPRAQLTLYASFVPPMLPLLKTASFCLDLAGPTTTGKTTALRLAASVWGAATEEPNGSILGTWDSTAVWRERTPGVLNNHPLLLDETKHVRRPQDVAATIYSVCQGHGRGRGTPGGIAHQDTWSTVLMSSGEQPLASFTQDGGTRARILALWGSPFGDISPETGQFVVGLSNRLKQHYGHAGPAFAGYLAATLDKSKKWRALYRQREKHYRQEASENAVAGRMAAHFAALYVTSVVVHEALELPFAWSDPIEPLYDELTSQSADADRSAAALQHVYSWACSHRSQFYCPVAPAPKLPHVAWYGVWPSKPAPVPSKSKKKKEMAWQHIGFLPHVLRTVLDEAGFDPASIVRHWEDRGWLCTTSESDCNRTTKRMSLDGQKVHMVVIKRQALIEVCDLGDD